MGESSQGGYCAVLLSGGVDCWGTNTSGALGNGSTTLPQADVPVAVTGISDATNGGTNNAFTYCMLLSSESVRCWGDNTDGQLGDGTSVASSNVPVGVLGVFKPVGLASDGTSFCAQLKSGGAQCWGSNADGALGDGSTAASSSVPVAVRGLNYIQKLFSRAGGYCVVIDGGGVKCWGSNANGSLGDGTTSGYSAVPVAVKGLSGVSSIDGTCAVLGNGKVKCWGSGVDGDLGNGTSGTPSDVAVPVSGLTGVTQVVGDYCALLKSGGVECWGSNDNDGALGNGSKEPFSDLAVPVKGIAGATSLVYDPAGGWRLLRFVGHFWAGRMLGRQPRRRAGRRWDRAELTGPGEGHRVGELIAAGPGFDAGDPAAVQCDDPVDVPGNVRFVAHYEHCPIAGRIK